MEIADRSGERSTVLTAVLTLVIIGVSLLVSTWQTISNQREIEEQHLFLTTRAVLLAVESSLRRGPVRDQADRLTEHTAEFFQAVEQGGDVIFVGIVDPRGGRLLTSSVRGNQTVQLPMEMLRELFEAGQWHGRLRVSNRMAYVYGKQLNLGPDSEVVFDDASGRSGLMPGFLVVGIDLDKHLSKGMRQNALFQALYILTAALFTWGLAVSFLARREQAGKAANLERFQVRLLDSIPDGLLTLDSDLLIRSANPAALAILKSGPGELMGRALDELPPAIAGAITGRDDDGRSEQVADWRRVSVYDSQLEVMTLPLSGDKKNAFLVILRDRTQLRTLEDSLAEAEKLAALGTMAAGVAHEVRNPLSSLRGFAQYFVKKLTGRQPEEEYAKAMVREADRLNRVITDLLFLARPRAVSPDIVEIIPLVHDITTLLRFDLEQKNVGIKTDLAVPLIYADEDALKQALLNLILNSLEATPENGDPITIASGQEPGGTWIEVRDKGSGMSEEEKQKAFAPFFTGKVRGTGLGLALVQRTMREHGGYASITSAPSKGSTVRLFFPAR